MLVKKNHSILITGVGGLLGKAVYSCLKQQGYKNILSPRKCDLDLLSKDMTLNYLIKNQPDIIIHLAAKVFGLGGNMKNQMNTILNNTLMDNNLFYSVSKLKVKMFFYAGSVASYPYPYKSKSLKESDFFNGEPHYGEYGYASAKRHALNYLKILSKEKGVNCTYGLLTNLYGEHDKFDIFNGHVIPSLIKKAYDSSLNNSYLNVWGSGNSERDFLHNTDAAKAILICLKKNIGFKIINIGSGEKCKISDIANILKNHAKLKGINYDKSKPEGIQSRVLDVNQIKEIGFKPTIILKEGIERLYDWYSKNY